MSRTTQRSDMGMWRPVLEEQRIVRWFHRPKGPPPDQASAAQLAFMEQNGVHAQMAAPITDGEKVRGGVSVVRFNVDVPYTEADERLLEACASRIGTAVAFRSASQALQAAAQDD